jgi:hypothetical protein
MPPFFIVELLNMEGNVVLTSALTYEFMIDVISLENIGSIMSTNYAKKLPPMLNFILVGSTVRSAFSILI